MNPPLLPLLIPLVLVSLLSLANAEDKGVAQAKSVQEALNTPWTSLYVGSVLLTDYARVYAIALEIVRDKPGAGMKCRPVQEADGAYRPLSMDEYKALEKTVIAAAADVEKEITRSEVWAAYTKQWEQARTSEEIDALKSKVPPPAIDALFLLVRAVAPSGSITYHNDGDPDKLEHHLANGFAIKQRQLSSAELKILLGSDPYASLHEPLDTDKPQKGE